MHRYQWSSKQFHIYRDMWARRLIYQPAIIEGTCRDISAFVYKCRLLLEASYMAENINKGPNSPEIGNLVALHVECRDVLFEKAARPNTSLLSFHENRHQSFTTLAGVTVNHVKPLVHHNLYYRPTNSHLSDPKTDRGRTEVSPHDLVTSA